MLALTLTLTLDHVVNEIWKYLSLSHYEKDVFLFVNFRSALLARSVLLARIHSIDLTYRNLEIPPHEKGGTAAVAPSGTSVFVVSAHIKGTSLSVWRLPAGTSQPRYRCHTPEKISAVALSPDGAWCVGGGASGKAYLWETATGSLLVHFFITSLSFAACVYIHI